MSLQAYAQDQGGGGGHDGNGGGGCIGTDGHLITFYDCGLYKPQPTDPTAPEIPSPTDGPSQWPEGLKELIATIQNLPYLDSGTKSKLLSAIQPTIYRKYFPAVPKELNPTTENRILFEFSRVTHFDRSRLGLFGVTDNRAKMLYLDRTGFVTYVLPGYNDLQTLNSKMAALFHESWWILFPESTEEETSNAEMTFQAMLDAPQDHGRLRSFIDLVRGAFLKQADGKLFDPVFDGTEAFGAYRMKLLLKEDLESGALKGFANDKNQITQQQLFGAESILCFNRNSNDEACHVGYAMYLNSLRQQYPKSRFLAEIAKLVVGSKADLESYFKMFETDSDYGSEFDNSTSTNHGVCLDLFLFDIDACSQKPSSPIQKALFQNSSTATAPVVIQLNPENDGLWVMTLANRPSIVDSIERVRQ